MDFTPKIEWNRMDSAPKDGTWLLLDVEDGSLDCVDYAVSCVYVGRWNPKSFLDLGDHIYDWEVIDRYPDGPHGNGEITTHWASGRVHGWLHMPNVL